MQDTVLFGVQGKKSRGVVFYSTEWQARRAAKENNGIVVRFVVKDWQMLEEVENV